VVAVELEVEPGALSRAGLPDRAPVDTLRVQLSAVKERRRSGPRALFVDAAKFQLLAQVHAGSDKWSTFQWVTESIQRRRLCSYTLGASFAHRFLMGNDRNDANEPRFVEEQGATEEQNEKIDAIVGDEVLGYDGSGRGEHSGQDVEPSGDRLTDSLANNRPSDVK
jgi:hypothetical protein